MIIHTCMISHLFIAMKNWPRRHIVLIIAMKGCWSFMIRYIRRSVKSSSHTIPEKVRNSRPINMGFKGWGWLLWWSSRTFKPFCYNKLNERVQTANFSVLSRLCQELCAENLKKRKTKKTKTWITQNFDMVWPIQDRPMWKSTASASRICVGHDDLSPSYWLSKSSQIWRKQIPGKAPEKNHAFKKKHCQRHNGPRVLSL